MNLRSIPNPREVISWGMFDLANQSFALLINTLLFGLFLKEAVLNGAAFGDLAWSTMGAASLAVVVVAGPVVGAIADARAAKKRLLVTTGICCAALTCSLALVPSGGVVGVTTALVCAALLYIPANVAFNFGENLLAAFLPEIARRDNMGVISALGWTMGYAGALLLLALTAVASKVMGLEEPEQFRPLLLFAGLWFGVMMIPTIRFLPEVARPVKLPEGVSVVDAGLGRLAHTIRHSADFRDLRALLVALLVYGMGMQVIVFFAGVIARDDFGFSTTKLVLFTAVATVTGGVGAVVTGTVQDRLGHKPTLLLFLGVWIATAMGLVWLSWLRETSPDPASLPVWPVWLVGNGIGLGLGGMGTATRATVGVLTPSHRTAEFFSLWGCTYKLAGVAGLPIFGAIRTQFGSVSSLVALTLFFLIGGIIVALFLNLPRGIAAAERAEAEEKAGRVAERVC